MSWSSSILLFLCHRQYPNVLLQVMSMDSRIANKDKTILSLQLEELEPVFMGKIAKTWSFSKVFFGRVCNPLFMVLCVGVLYPYLLAFVANIYFNADTHIIVLHPHISFMLCIIVVTWELTLLCTLLLIALFWLQSYLIIVIFFTLTQFLENKIYTQKTRKLRQNTQ